MPPHATQKTATVSASDGDGIKAPGCRTEILIRLWTRTEEGKKLPPDEANKKRQGAIAFIEDVIVSKRGALVSTEDGFFVSILGSPADALVVSRQILHGMRGFQDKSGDHPVSVSISIDANLQGPGPDEASATSASENSAVLAAPPLQASHDLASLIRMSRPAQVLLTHDLLQQVSSLKGLPLKPFQGRFGVFEYVWTPEEKLREFQDQQTGFVDLIEVPKTSPQLEPPPSTSPAMDTFFEPRAKTPFGSEEVQTPAWKRMLRTPWAIAGVATLVMAILIAGGVVLRGKKPAQVPTAPINQASTTISQPTPKIPDPVPAPPKKHQPPRQETPAVSEGPKPAHQDVSKKTDVTAADASKPAVVQPRSECKLPGDLQSYIRVAEGYRGHGQYTDAERVFTQILACDPGNQEARKGLDRTRAAQASTSPR